MLYACCCYLYFRSSRPPPNSFTNKQELQYSLYYKMLLSLTYDDGIVRDLFCVVSVVVKSQMPDACVQVLDESSLVHVH